MLFALDFFHPSTLDGPQLFQRLFSVFSFTLETVQSKGTAGVATAVEVSNYEGSEADWSKEDGGDGFQHPSEYTVPRSVRGLGREELRIRSYGHSASWGAVC